MMRWLPLIVVLAPVVVSAEPAEDASPPSSEEPTATDVEGAPLPGQEGGRVDREPGEGAARKVGRGILFVPRAAVEIVFTPVRAGVWAYDRYRLKERLREIFISSDDTYALYPTAMIDSQYGVSIGARFVHRDLFGEAERLSLQAGTGWSQHVLSGRLSTGNRLGDRVRFELVGEYEKRPQDRFYGIGNTEIRGLPSEAGDMPVIETRFEQRIERAALLAELRPLEYLRFVGSAAVADFEFGRSDDGPPIDVVYPAEAMVGFGGDRHAYTELEVSWDSRRRASAWEPPAVRAAGALLSGFAGRITALDDGANYWRYGMDLQQFIRVGEGPRVLTGRLYAESVSGDLDEVPFAELPRLGGRYLLRGYAIDRFHDRVAMMGSVEYSWDLMRHLSASTFVDAGRVYSSLSDITFDNIRVGYGVSLEFHTDRHFIARATLASSIDGGLFVDLAFDPVFDLAPRVERK